MVKWTRASVVLLLLSLAACTGDDSGGNGAQPVDAVVGSFVGQVSGTDAFVAVVAAPAGPGADSRAVQVYLSDGSGLSEWFSGSISDNTFDVKSDDGDAEADGTLTAESVTGTVVLPGGKTVEYRATPPSGGAGLYDLTVSSAGELSGASAAGLGVTGQITFGEPGTGMLRLVDGKRLEFGVTPSQAGALAHLQAGQVHLIVLPDGQVRGAGKSDRDGHPDFVIRSA